MCAGIVGGTLGGWAAQSLRSVPPPKPEVPVVIKAVPGRVHYYSVDKASAVVQLQPSDQVSIICDKRRHNVIYVYENTLAVVKEGC